ncbi:SIR2 family NAD-dependent protein deacylase [Azospirillum thermophilum]|uniref:SIR2 family protein n=1 Tax=Azospirillum thermophilum TaxID=2202148 RepID=A0A2S2CQS3_9PROT|nr:SIR2 family protein [Azospirillum thermophilum]AWK86775.1 SIR2 family protein [Azospirillum thermophilum]
MTETLSTASVQDAADPDAVIRDIAGALAARTAVPYLGPAAFALLEPADCPIPRNSAELTQRLNAKVAAPGRIRSQLTAVAQFIETRRHRKTLEAILTDIFRRSVPPTPVHRFLASIPAPPLIVDVWYDDVLETLLSGSADRAWGQIQGLSHPQSTGEWVKYYAPDGSEVTSDTASAWDTVLYKPSGSVSPAGNYLISDSDFVEILTEIDIQTPIPPVVQQRRTGRSFLFLGCRFDQEIQRTFARQIAKRSGDRHWAVIPGELTRNEARFLEQHAIRRLDLPLDEAVARIAAALKS